MVVIDRVGLPHHPWERVQPRQHHEPEDEGKHVFPGCHARGAREQREQGGHEDDVEAFVDDDVVTRGQVEEQFDLSPPEGPQVAFARDAGQVTERNRLHLEQRHEGIRQLDRYAHQAVGDR